MIGTRGDEVKVNGDRMMSAQRGRLSNLENCGQMRHVRVRGNRSVSLNKVRKTRNNIGLPSIQLQNGVELKNHNGNYFFF